jgi:hypothetical protein
MAMVLTPFAVVAVLALQTPAFYVERAVQPENSRELSKNFFNRSTRFVNSLLNAEGRWRETFDEAGFNAWLEHDFEPNLKKALPWGVADPRVALESGLMRVGFRWGVGPIATVVEVKVGVWVPKDNLLAVELHGASAGNLPLPTTYVRRVFEQVAEAAACEIKWKRRGSNLVGLVKLPSLGRNVLLRRAEIAEGAITFSGQNLSAAALKDGPTRR